MPDRPQHSDLLIVGGGVLGAFHAYAALERGLKVRLVERNRFPTGATTRNFGQVVPSGMTKSWQRFGRKSLQIYNSIQSQFDISVKRNGSIYLASDDEELCLLEELCAINAENDYKSRLLTKEQCLQQYPGLREDYCVGGLFFPQEVSVNPRKMIHAFHKYLQEQPDFESTFGTMVSGIESTGGTARVNTTDGRQFSAERVIICCGTEFRSLFPNVFEECDLKVVKLQMMRLKPQPQVVLPGNILTGLSIRRYESFSECPSWPAIKERESGDGFADEFGIHMLFKQEADGGIIVGDSHEYASVSTIDQLSAETRNDINQYFLSEGRRIFDLEHWSVEATWSGMYCQTTEDPGVFLRTIDDNIHIVTGIGGKGMTGSAGFAQHHLEQLLNDQARCI